MDKRPIGVFDSGYGGLTVVRALRRLLPEEDIVFFADTGRAPYGCRPVPQLRRMARQNLDLILGFDVKIILAACGTISCNAPDLLQSCPVPCFGVLDAPVKAIAAARESGPIGLIATEATVRSGAFARALEEACPERHCVSVACPDFVPLIESGHYAADDPAVKEAVARYLAPLAEKGVQTLLLGCTHYGLIAEAIRNYMGEGVDLVDASECASLAVSETLRRGGLCGGSGKLRCLTSGDPDIFASHLPFFLGEQTLPEILRSPIMEV